jgi:hypothetical protein
MNDLIGGFFQASSFIIDAAVLFLELGTLNR